MAKEEANVRDFRTFVLKNFRNFAPFCAGTEDDPDDLKEFLELNRGLTLELKSSAFVGMSIRIS